MVKALVGTLITLALLAGSAHAASGADSPGVRLPDSVTPLAYDVELTLVPWEDRFDGHVIIEVDIQRPTQLIWLNAARLDIKRVQVSMGKQRYGARVQVAAHETLGLRLDRVMPAGHASISLDYQGTLDRVDSNGPFKIKLGDDWYIYTQFEPVAARRAFPCFDEPGFKTPWKIALTVPAGMTAVSNAAQTGVEPLSHGMKRVRFAQTAPLPSYLVAFGVGPFDVVDGGTVGRRALPLRYIVPRGQGVQTRYAREITPRLIDILEDYLDQPYPFDKLDALAIPVPDDFGAMENAGLITYAANLMLAPPDRETPAFRVEFAGLAAHELSHQWFGNLVTPRWWDDLWLNESFANWSGAKTLRHVDPAWLTRLSEDDERQQAILLDRLLAARRIREPVDSEEQVNAAFDAITYQKGASVLRMVENWIGEDRMRDAVRRYLQQHAFGSARADDFIAALDSAGAGSFPELPAVMHSMLDQPGVVAVDISLDCGEGDSGQPRLDLVQHRFLPTQRASNAHVADALWSLPACFQYGDGGDFGELCTVLTEAHQVLALPAGEKCPGWVVGNRDGASYMLPILKEPLASALKRAPLLPEEAVAVLGDTRILVQSADMPLDAALTLAKRMAASRQPPVALAAVRLMRSIPPAWYASPEDREAIGRFVRTSFGPRAQLLGWLPKPGERVVEGFLRAELLPLVADLGQDAGLRKDADALARDWLAGRVEPGEMRLAILTTAARHGSPELLQSFTEAAEHRSGSARADLFAAIGSVQEPGEVDAVLALVINEHTEESDGHVVLAALGSDAEVLPQLERFLQIHMEDVVRRYGEDSPALIAGFAARLCESGQRRDFERLFTERILRAPAAARFLAQSLEAADLCIANQAEQSHRLHALLAQ